MALPTQSDIVKMDYPSRGGPFVEVVAKSGIDGTTLDYPSRGGGGFFQAFGSAAAAAVQQLLSLMGVGS